MSGRIRKFVAILAIAASLQMFVLVATPAAAPKQHEEGPGYCWDTYVREAVAVFDEWVDCHDNVAWYDLIGFIACDVTYEARAIGAAMWWAKCVGMPGRAL